MVNDTTNTRSQILEHLYRAGGETLSGVQLSQRVGISRVAVWKHINGLKENGFEIQSSPKGYCLAHPGDLLHGFCFAPPLGERIAYFPELNSTMDQARILAREGAPHLTCVVAERQTRARGRLDRQWDSDRGGLWLTLILKPTLPPPLAYLYNFAASFCLARTLNRRFKLEVRVKWPNDLLLGDKKLAGLLSEMETRSDMLRFLLLGIGINANNPVSGGAYQHGAVSLKQALGQPVFRREILTDFLVEFETQTRNMDPGRIINAWKEETATIGRQVRIQTLNDVLEGRAVDVDPQGTLLVEEPDGRIRDIIFGDCFHT